MDHSSTRKNHDVHPPVPQIPSVGLTSSCNEAQLLEKLQYERLKSDTLERDLAKLRKELDSQRKELDCQRKDMEREFDSLSLLLEYANLSREELEKKLSKGLKALTGSG